MSETWPDNLCPRCGWDWSSHGNSHGPRSDCPWGVSPRAAAGELPRDERPGSDG